MDRKKSDPEAYLLQEILDWSRDLPVWQRDALRRLAAQGVLSETDLEELIDLAKSEHGLAVEASLSSRPLSEGDLPRRQVSRGVVTLKSVTHYQGVNALAKDQRLEFGPGLTVVYGANAAGKSGYTRILKQACRARGAEESILGNVLSDLAPGRPRATIEYSVDDGERTYSWEGRGSSASDELHQVSVFDTHCSVVYLTEETDVAFRPFGLDLLDALSGACLEVGKRLSREKSELEGIPDLDLSVPENTEVAKVLGGLSALTKQETIRRLASLTEEERTALERKRREVRDLAVADTAKESRRLFAVARGARSLCDRYREFSRALSDDELTRLGQEQEKIRELRSSAKQARASAFGENPLDGTGSEAWRSMWRAAEQFSRDSAYEGQEFPVVEGDDALCLLCQQELSSEARERLQGFADFLASRAEREAEDREQVLMSGLRDLQIDTAPADPTRESGYSEVQVENEDLASRVAAVIAQIRTRQLLLSDVLRGDRVLGSVEVLGEIPHKPLDELGEFSEELSERAKALGSDDAGQRVARLKTEIAELEARLSLGDSLPAVLSEIDRRVRIAVYEQCINDTRTNAITRKSSTLTQEVVTDALKDAFQRELEAICFSHLEVELQAARGSRGTQYHRLQLSRAKETPLPRVLSEGEATPVWWTVSLLGFCFWGGGSESLRLAAL